MKDSSFFELREMHFKSQHAPVAVESALSARFCRRLTDMTLSSTEFVLRPVGTLVALHQRGCERSVRGDNQ
jgi:hypothetical protein